MEKEKFKTGDKVKVSKSIFIDRKVRKGEIIEINSWGRIKIKSSQEPFIFWASPFYVTKSQ